MGVLILILIVIGLTYSRSARGGYSADRCGTGFWVPLLIWGGCFIPCLVLWLVLSETLPSIEPYFFGYVTFCLLFVSPLLIPFVYATLFSLGGHYRLAYRFARNATFVYRRDRLGGALYQSYQALNRLQDGTQKLAAVNWLREQYTQSKTELLSGAMTMIVILEGMPECKTSVTSLAHKLALLDGVGRESIPRAVSVLAVKIALAPNLAKGDWLAIVPICEQWDTPASNPVAQYLLAYHERRVTGSAPSFSLFGYYWRCLRVKRWPLLFNLPDYLANAAVKAADQAAGLAEAKVATLFESGVNTNVKIDAVQALITDAEQSRWVIRAKELGLVDPEQAWLQITKSVHRYQQALTGKVDLADDRQYAESEHRKKYLQYLAQSIVRRKEARGRYDVSRDFSDWLAILQKMTEQNASSESQSELFYLIHGVIWNWVADLWNIRRQRGLAYFIAVKCTPLARDAGCRELRDILSGIALGDYK